MQLYIINWNPSRGRFLGLPVPLPRIAKVYLKIPLPTLPSTFGILEYRRWDTLGHPTLGYPLWVGYPVNP